MSTKAQTQLLRRCFFGLEVDLRCSVTVSRKYRRVSCLASSDSANICKTVISWNAVGLNDSSIRPSKRAHCSSLKITQNRSQLYPIRKTINQINTYAWYFQPNDVIGTWRLRPQRRKQSSLFAVQREHNYILYSIIDRFVYWAHWWAIIGKLALLWASDVVLTQATRIVTSCCLPGAYW